MNLANVIRNMGQSLEEKANFSDKEVKMAIGIASDPRYKKGNMTGAVRSIEKVKKGLSDHPQVAAVLRRQNEEVELEEAMSSRTSERFQSAEAELAAYAKKSGGVDKKDFMDVAKMLGQIGRLNILQSGQVLSRLNRKLSDMDTDPRDKVYSILKQKGLMESLQEAPEDNEPASPDEGKMALQQLEFIEYAAEEIEEHIKAGGEFPEWMQNKLATVNDNMQSLHAQIDHDAIEDDDDEEELDEAKSPMVTFTVPNVTSDMASKLERTAKEKNIEYSRKGRTVVLKGKRIDVTMLRTKMGLAQTNIPMVPVKEEVELTELEEDFYNVIYRNKQGKVEGEKEFDSKSAAEKYAKLGNSRDKVGGKYTVTLVRDGGRGRRNEELEMDINEAREDTATQVARALKKMGVKPNAKEADIIKKIPDVLKKMGLGDNKLIKRDPDFIGDVLDSMNEEVNLDELFESAFEEPKLSLEDTLKAIWEGKKLDPVNKKALKKDFDDRKDKDLDNDGDTDDSDEYLHKKRQATSKAIEKGSDKAEKDQEKEVSDKEDEPKGTIGKSKKQTKVDVNPSIDEEREMSDAEMKKRDDIMKGLEKKKDEFVKKYGDRAKEVMARTAIKMAMKESTAAYGKSQRAIADKKKNDAISSSDKNKLGKIADLMNREKQLKKTNK